MLEKISAILTKNSDCKIIMFWENCGESFFFLINLLFFHHIHKSPYYFNITLLLCNILYLVYKIHIRYVFDTFFDMLNNVSIICPKRIKNTLFWIRNCAIWKLSLQFSKTIVFLQFEFNVKIANVFSNNGWVKWAII